MTHHALALTDHLLIDTYTIWAVANHIESTRLAKNRSNIYAMTRDPSESIATSEKILKEFRLLRSAYAVGAVISHANTACLHRQSIHITGSTRCCYTHQCIRKLRTCQ